MLVLAVSCRNGILLPLGQQDPWQRARIYDLLTVADHITVGSAPERSTNVNILLSNACK